MSKNNDEEFGRRIAFLRKKIGLTQKEAALQIGVSYSAYQRYEAGGSPSNRNIDKLVNFFKCKRTWLLLGEGATFTNEETEVILNEDDGPLLPKSLQKTLGDKVIPLLEEIIVKLENELEDLEITLPSKFKASLIGTILRVSTTKGQGIDSFIFKQAVNLSKGLADQMKKQST